MINQLIAGGGIIPELAAANGNEENSTINRLASALADAAKNEAMKKHDHPPNPDDEDDIDPVL